MLTKPVARRKGIRVPYIIYRFCKHFVAGRHGCYVGACASAKLCKAPLSPLRSSQLALLPTVTLIPSRGPSPEPHYGALDLICDLTVPSMRSLVSCILFIAAGLSFRQKCCQASSKLFQRSYVPDSLAELQQRQGILAEASTARARQDSGLPRGAGGFESQTNHADSPHTWADRASHNEQDDPTTLKLFPLSPERAPLAYGSPTALGQSSGDRNDPAEVIAERPLKRPRIASGHQHSLPPERTDDGAPTALQGLALWPPQAKETHAYGRSGVDNGVRSRIYPGSSNGHLDLQSFHISKLPQHPTSLNSILSRDKETAIHSPSSATSFYTMSDMMRKMYHSHVPTNEQNPGSSSTHAELQGSQRTYDTRPNAPLTLNLLRSKNDEIALNPASSEKHPERPLDSSRRSMALPFQGKRVRVDVDELRTDEPEETPKIQLEEEMIAKTLMKRPAQLVNTPMGTKSRANLPDETRLRVGMGDSRASIHAVSRTEVFEVTGPSPPVEQLLRSHPSLMLAWKPEVICKKASCAAALLATDLLECMGQGRSLRLLQKLHYSHGIIIPFTYDLILKDRPPEHWRSVKLIWRDFWNLLDDKPLLSPHVDQEAGILYDFLWMSEFISECTIPTSIETMNRATTAKVLESSATRHAKGVTNLYYCGGLALLIKELSTSGSDTYKLNSIRRQEKLNLLIDVLRNDFSAYTDLIQKNYQYSQALNNEILKRLQSLCKKITGASKHLAGLMDNFTAVQLQRFKKLAKNWVAINFRQMSANKEMELLRSIPEETWKPFYLQLSEEVDQSADGFSAKFRKPPDHFANFILDLQGFLHKYQDSKTASWLPGKIHQFVEDYKKD